MNIERFNSSLAPLLNIDKQSARRVTFPSLSSVRNVDLKIPDVPEEFVMEGVSYRGLVTAVQYRQDHILYYPKTKPNELGLSFEFTGCVMAQFKCNGTTYIAHIYLEPGHDTRNAWNQFVRTAANDMKNEFGDFVLFKPYASFHKDFYEEQVREAYSRNAPLSVSVSVCGIMDGFDCYSIIMSMTNCHILHAIRINYAQKLIEPLTTKNMDQVFINDKTEYGSNLGLMPQNP